MNEAFASLAKVLCDVVVPNLKAVQVSQAEQIAANNRLEHALEDLRVQLEREFAQLSSQLIACRAELAATQAALKAAQDQGEFKRPDGSTLIH
jgi:hypothetical protein